MYAHFFMLAAVLCTGTGERLQPRIIGGSEVPLDSDLYSFVHPITGVGSCTATAVSPVALVTAQHCVSQNGGRARVALPRTPGVAVMMNDSSTFRFVTSNITVTPPGFHEVAVIVFTEPLFQSYVSLDGVGSLQAYSHTDSLLIAGYGARTITATGSGLGLRLVSGLPLDDAICTGVSPWGASGEWACMAQLGGAACYGDSGGPVIWRGDGASPGVLLGVISMIPASISSTRGMDCVTVPFILVYKVAPWASWINNVIERISSYVAAVELTPPAAPLTQPRCLC